MTRMYLMTEAQHAQIVDALELPSLKNVSMLLQRDAALAILRCMQPVEPCAWMVEDADKRHFIFRMAKPEIHEGEYVYPLYTPEQSK